MPKKIAYRDLSNVSLADDSPKQRGKRDHQKLKPYLVMQYLLQKTDPDHLATVFDIIDYLEKHGVAAERRSIYRDIDDINKVLWVAENDVSMEEADEAIKDPENCCVHFHKSREKSGYYVKQRQYDKQDIQILVEALYTARFLNKGHANRLADVLCRHVSEHQAQGIRHDVHLVDRVQTTNHGVLNTIYAINQAMSLKLDGKRHTPEKIRFLYQTFTLDNLDKPTDRRKGTEYIVSPYMLLINDANYYLLAYDDRDHRMHTYRVDRMRKTELTGEPREGAEAFAAVDMSRYTQRVFSMYQGRPERVTIQFINPLLDAVIDRFGTNPKHVRYAKVDDRHFSVTTQVEISDPFYGWLLSFGRRAKLIGPESEVEKFKTYLDRVREKY